MTTSQVSNEQAEQEGRAAFHAGTAPNDTPYRIPSRAAAYWSRGWAIEREETTAHDIDAIARWLLTNVPSVAALRKRNAPKQKAQWEAAREIAQVIIYWPGYDRHNPIPSHSLTITSDHSLAHIVEEGARACFYTTSDGPYRQNTAESWAWRRGWFAQTFIHGGPIIVALTREIAARSTCGHVNLDQAWLLAELIMAHAGYCVGALLNEQPIFCEAFEIPAPGTL